MIGKLKSPEITISGIGELNLLITSDVILTNLNTSIEDSLWVGSSNNKEKLFNKII